MAGVFRVLTWLLLIAAFRPGIALAALGGDPCTRPPVGSTVPEHPDLRSRDGVLRVEFAVRNHREPDGSIRFCYVMGDGVQSPTLRMHPGDLLLLKLKNDVDDFHVQDREIYWLCQTRQSESPFFKVSIEKMFKIRVSYRGMNTVQRLAKKYPPSAP